jgi:hypothetical protein
MPSFWALVNGEEYAGATVHRMAEKIDEGEILIQEEVDIRSCRSVYDVISRTKEVGSRIVRKALIMYSIDPGLYNSSKTILKKAATIRGHYQKMLRNCTMLGNASHREGDRMNIAIFTDSFPPEISSCAVLMNELATEMTIRGHSVTVVTYQPHGRISIDVSLPEETRENEITIIRVKAPQTHIRNLIRRGLNTIAASLLLERKSKAI